MSEFHDPGSGSGASLDRRVAVIEQIAADTRDALRELRTDIRDLRGEMRDLRSEMRDVRGDMNDLRSDMNRQFRWLVGIWLSSLGATLAVMAHGFGWL